MESGQYYLQTFAIQYWNTSTEINNKNIEVENRSTQNNEKT
jgi:hypothetical protein